MPLPDNVNTVDRFQRATLLPGPVVVRQAVYVHRIPDGRRAHQAGCDVFEWLTSPSVSWVELTMKLGDDSSRREINPYDSTLVGDVTSRFQPQREPFQSREYAVN